MAGHAAISAVQPVIHPEDAALYRPATEGLALLPAVPGGASRQASVCAGLEALEPLAPALVLVHDAARPFASEALISRAIAAAQASGAAVPVIPVADTVKTVDAAGAVTGTIDRAQLRLVQTPQAFGFTALLDAHRKARAAGRDDFTDDAALAEWAGLAVTTFEGEAGNVKLTTNEDFARAETRKLAALSDVRTGFGFDVHQFGAGDHVTLGGVRIAHGQGLSGHSDADVVLHALVDAILGALADGDIGVHFPPTDPQWRGTFVRRRHLRGRATAQARRAHRPSRRDHRMRGAADRPPSRCHAYQDRRARRHSGRARGRESDHERKNGLYRPWRRHGGICPCHRAPALERLSSERSMSDPELIERASELLDLCRARKLKIAAAEILHRRTRGGTLTEIAGSSDVFERGFVTYSNEAKIAMLGVPASVLEAHGAVSRETAEAMAAGALGDAPADLAVSITGIAGPGGAVAGKPVGLVHFGGATRGGRRLHHERRYGDIGRAEVRHASVLEALAMLRELAE